MGPKMLEALELMKSGRVFAIKELKNHGVDRKVLRRLVDSGEVEKEHRGFYRISPISDFLMPQDTFPDDLLNYTFLDENAHLLEQAAEGAFFSFYSALSIHHLSDENNHKIWISYPADKGLKHFPSDNNVRIYRFKDEKSLKVGIEKVELNGKNYNVCSLERAVIDIVRTSNLGRSPKEYVKDPVSDIATANSILMEYYESPNVNIDKLKNIAGEFKIKHRIETSLELGYAFNKMNYENNNDKEDLIENIGEVRGMRP